MPAAWISEIVLANIDEHGCDPHNSFLFGTVAAMVVVVLNILVALVPVLAFHS